MFSGRDNSVNENYSVLLSKKPCIMLHITVMINLQNGWLNYLGLVGLVCWVPRVLVVVISGLPTDVSCSPARGHSMATVASLFNELEFGTASVLNVVIQRWSGLPPCISDLACIGDLACICTTDWDPQLVLKTRLLLEDICMGFSANTFLDRLAEMISNLFCMITIIYLHCTPLFFF